MTQTALTPLHEAKAPDELRPESGAASTSAAEYPGAARKKAPIDSSYQDYLFGAAGSSAHPAWSDSTAGRAAIRLVSRGLVGAAFFAWGGRYAGNKLRDYDAERWGEAAGEGANLFQKMAQHNVLQNVAKGFDATIGDGVKTVARLVRRSTAGAAAGAEIERSAEQAVLFRTKGYFHTQDGLLNKSSGPMNGRSYGAEVVGITFDFAMASIGDATTRSAIQALDPNIRKAWMVDDNGEVVEPGEKGHFDAKKFATAFTKGAWRIFSKNQGEDWFAAIPYVYQMKLQRQFINNIFNKQFQGHKIQFDNGWNGGAFRVNEQGQIIGDLQLAGAMDLHARFVGYNFYTLMYREAYDSIARGFKDWKEHGFAIHPHLPENPISEAISGIGNATRYVAKSFIKANLYMNPAVVAFWIFRVPQSKWRGGLIHSDAAATENCLMTSKPVDLSQPHMVMEGQHNYNATANTPANAAGMHLYGQGTANHTPNDTLHLGGRLVPNPIPGHDPYNPAIYEHYKTETTLDKVEKGFSRALNPLGSFSFWAGTKATKLADTLASKSKTIDRFLSVNPAGNYTAAARERFVRGYMDAAISYTPYMWAKAETALRVDDRGADGKLGQMDTAIYRLIDDVTTFNFHDAWAATKQIAHLGTHFENRELKVREGGEEPMAPHAMAKQGAMPSSTILPEGRVLTPVAMENVGRREEAANDSQTTNVRKMTEKNWSKTIEKQGKNDELLVANGRN